MENPPGIPAGRPHLFVREGGRIVDAPPADQAVAAGYDQAPDKGPAAGGYRLTLLAEGPACKVGQPVRIIHVCESVASDAPVYPMGPKPVTGEYVDGHLVAPQGPAEDQPLIPPSYDGRVAPGPGLDFNFDITEYSFGTPGRHSVQWRPGSWESNTLWFDVT